MRRSKTELVLFGRVILHCTGRGDLRIDVVKEYTNFYFEITPMLGISNIKENTQQKVRIWFLKGEKIPNINQSVTLRTFNKEGQTFLIEVRNWICASQFRSFSADVR